jgi:hypothetical protein
VSTEPCQRFSLEILFDDAVIPVFFKNIVNFGNIGMIEIVKNVGFRGCAALMGKVLRDAFDDPFGTERNVLREPYGALRMNTQCGNDFVSVYVRINSSFLLKLSERRKLYK